MDFLIVDDDFVTLTKLITNLSGYGKCVPATHSHQALDIFTQKAKKNEPFTLVLIDINLPDVSGFALAEKLKQIENELKLKPSKKVIMTANSNAINVKKAVSMRLDGLLVKPIRIKTLIAKLTSMGLVKTWQGKPKAVDKTPKEPVKKEQFSSISELKLSIRDDKKKIFKFSLDDPIMLQLMDSLAEVEAERKFNGK